jgi:pSer/pThr/pTyr-binding forkhead associated (FHA) protein
MNDSANENGSDTIVGPPAAASTATPDGFVPLRLVLLPSGVILELDRTDMTLGRHTGADLRLPLPDVSRRHCRFIWAAGVWSVTDLASTNGVFVNGLSVQRSDLVQGDLVSIGGFTFSVDLSYPDPPKALPPATSRLQSVVSAVQGGSRLTPYRRAS